MLTASRHATRAQMAELVDAPASGAGARKGVEVRVLFWAPFPVTRRQARTLRGGAGVVGAGKGHTCVTPKRLRRRAGRSGGRAGRVGDTGVTKVTPCHPASRAR